MSKPEHRLKAWYWEKELGPAIPAGDPRLVPVPSTPAGRICRLHWYAAWKFKELDDAFFAATGMHLKVQSGHREIKSWQLTVEAYHDELYRRYRKRWPELSRDEVIKKGKLYLAYRSAHFTGLAIDIGTCGLEPISRTKDDQMKTVAYKWLREHAPDYGWRNYGAEPWHWECPISRELYESPLPEAPLDN